MEQVTTNLQPEILASSPATSRERIESLLELIAEHKLKYEDAPPVDPALEYGCARCAGHGWIMWEVPRTDPDFGKTFPCDCLKPVLERDRVAKLFKGAAVPPEYESLSFETYRAMPISGAQQLASEVAEGWANAGERSLMLTGAVGLGKTGLAVAAMRKRQERDHCAALFVTTIDLLDAIRATYSDSGATEGDVLGTVRTVPLLVLDDIGRERIAQGERGDWVRERLFAIVNHRQIQHLATIYTSNRDISELAEHLGDATAWRIKMACWPSVVQMDGTNLRALD
jgi:DNA replication protein DnaC